MNLYAALALAYQCSPVGLWSAPPDLIDAMIDTLADRVKD